MIRFKDRADAGRQLADSLSQDVVQVDYAFAIPRGGLQVGAAVARRFDVPLLPAFVTKIRHPLEPELAIGALDLRKHAIWREGVRGELSPEELEQSTETAWQLLERRRRMYSSVIPQVDVFGRTVVLVDDGLATGLTCLAALKWLRTQRPELLLLAVPCASSSGVALVRPDCDGILTLAPADPYFTSVGQYYDDFSQVDDLDAMRLLRDSNAKFLSKPSAA